MLNLLVCSIVLASQHSSHHSATEKDKTLLLKCGRFKFEILESRKAPSPYMDINRAWGEGCGDSGKDKVVLYIDATYGKDVQINIPKSTFGDLYAINFIKVTATKRGCKLTIDGADGGEGYTATIFLDKIGAYAREVRCGEFSNAYYEKTQYRYLKDSDVD